MPAPMRKLTMDSGDAAQSDKQEGKDDPSEISNYEQL